MPRFQRGAHSKTERLRVGRLKALFDSYVHRAGGSSADREAHFAALQYVDDLAFHAPEQFLEFLEFAIASQGSSADIQALGSGPLNYALARHPDLVIDRIEDLARRHGDLRKLITQVSEEALRPDVWRRLRDLVGR